VLLRRSRPAAREERAALQAASIAGPALRPAAASRTCAGGRSRSTRRAGARLVHANGDEVVFSHALISRLPRTRRCCTRRGATCTPARPDWYATRDPVLRAEHLERARRPAGAAGVPRGVAGDGGSALRPEHARSLARRGVDVAADGHGRARRCGGTRGELGARPRPRPPQRSTRSRARSPLAPDRAQRAASTPSTLAPAYRLSSAIEGGVRRARRGGADRRAARARRASARASPTCAAACISRAASASAAPSRHERGARARRATPATSCARRRPSSGRADAMYASGGLVSAQAASTAASRCASGVATCARRS
jgi:hypothetical protein